MPSGKLRIPNLDESKGKYEQLVADRDEAHRRHKADSRNTLVRESVAKVTKKMVFRNAAAEANTEVIVSAEVSESTGIEEFITEVVSYGVFFNL